MRLVTYADDGAGRAGVQTEAGVIDAAPVLGVESITVRELVEADRVGELAKGIEAGGPAPVRDPVLLPPLPDPDKIVCIGLNYRSHAAEAGIDPPEQPTFFAKFRNALVPAGATVELPAASEKVDYEAEVAFIVGRRCKDVDPDEALEAIAGYMLLNDLSARDLQFATPQWMPGKVFDGSAPCGPALVTPDEAGAPRRDLLHTRPQRRADAGRLDVRPGLLRGRAGGATLPLDEPGAGRHRLDRDSLRGRQRARAPGLAAARRRDRDLLSHAG